MNDKLIKEIGSKLKAPLVAMERVAKGQYLPKVFAQVALDELKGAQALVEKRRRPTEKKKSALPVVLAIFFALSFLISGCGKAERAQPSAQESRYTLLKEDRSERKMAVSILVKPDISELQIISLLKELCASYKAYNSDVVIWMFTSKEQYEAESGLWLAMITHREDEPAWEMNIDREQLKLLQEKPVEKFGLSEAQRKKIYWSMAEDEDRAMMEAVKVYPCLDDSASGWSPDAAADQVHKQNQQRNKFSALYRSEAPQKHGLTREQLDEINIEGGKKKWPVPSPERIARFIESSKISVQEANSKIDACKVEGISMDATGAMVFISHGKDFQVLKAGDKICGGEVVKIYVPKEPDGVTLTNDVSFYDFRVKMKISGGERIFKNGDYISERPLPVKPAIQQQTIPAPVSTVPSVGQDYYSKLCDEVAMDFEQADTWDSAFQNEEALKQYRELLIKAREAFSTTNIADKERMQKIIAQSERREREISKYLEMVKLIRGQVDSPEAVSKWLHKNIHYESDRTGDDYWQAPYETLEKKAGDCEDYAFLAQALLSEIGIQSQVVMVSYKKGIEGKAHAMCFFGRGAGYEYFSGSILSKTPAVSIEQIMNQEYPGWLAITNLDFKTKSRTDIARK